MRPRPAPPGPPAPQAPPTAHTCSHVCASPWCRLWKASYSILDHWACVSLTTSRGAMLPAKPLTRHVRRMRLIFSGELIWTGTRKTAASQPLAGEDPHLPEHTRCQRNPRSSRELGGQRSQVAHPAPTPPLRCVAMDCWAPQPAAPAPHAPKTKAAEQFSSEPTAQWKPPHPAEA